MDKLKKLKDFFVDKQTKEKREMLEEFNQSKNDILESINDLLSLLNPMNADTSIGKDVYQDVEFFNEYNGATGSTVYKTINTFATKGGEAFGEQVMSKPLYDIELLEKRSNIIQQIEAKEVEEDMKSNLEVMKKYEPNVIWIFDQREQNLEDLFNMLYFRFPLLQQLNKYPTALSSYNIYRILISPLIGILSPVMYFLIPYLILCWKLKDIGIKITFGQYVRTFVSSVFGSQDMMMMFMSPSSARTLKFLSMVSYAFTAIFYFQGLFNSVEVSRMVYKLCSLILNKFQGVVKYLKAACKVNTTYWTNEINGLFFIGGLNNELEKENEYVNALLDRNFSFLSNFGKELSDYKLINKDLVKSILLRSYVVDFLYGVVSYRRNQKYTYVNFSTDLKPLVQVKGVRHPCLDGQGVGVGVGVGGAGTQVVKNNFELKNDNIIITGPNAGGKSTFIKSILISVLMAQTICIAPCDALTMTPFKNIISQINIPDCKGSESLFEAEMYRCRENLKLLKEKPDENTFIIMDEIFNSTNPVEGIAGAYAIAKQISKYPKCLLMFTTHYIYLTKLAKETKRFKNHRMNVIINPETHEITFPYKLAPGFSRQYIALELLKKSGFETDIIDEALSVKERLVAFKS